MSGVNLIQDLRWTRIRDALSDELIAIPSVKLVHPYIRWDIDKQQQRKSQNEQRFRKLHIPDGESIINAWAISRIEETREWDTNREIIVRILVALNFWYELNDDAASQDTFDNIVDDVMTALQEPIRLDCEVELQGPAQITELDHRYFATKLVHHAEIQTVTEHRVEQKTFR